jgi:hypothetical protein
VVIGIEVVIGPDVIFPEGLTKNDVNTVEVAIIAAMYKVTTADSSETPLLIKLNLFYPNKILTV